MEGGPQAVGQVSGLCFYLSPSPAARPPFPPFGREHRAQAREIVCARPWESPPPPSWNGGERFRQKRKRFGSWCPERIDLSLFMLRLKGAKFNPEKPFHSVIDKSEVNKS